MGHGKEVKNVAKKVLYPHHREVLHFVFNFRNFFRTEGGVHSLRCGEKLALCSDDLGVEMWLLEKAGCLHDVGKSLVDQKILYKKGRLTDEEAAEVAKHSGYGYQLLAGAEPLVREAALGHHAVTKEGPLWLQVFHLIDIEDACGNDRCYRPAMAEKELQETMVKACDKMSREAASIFWRNYNSFRKLDELCSIWAPH